MQPAVHTQGSHTSWKVMESPGFFFLKNPRTWKVLESYFGPGKSWKNILESYMSLMSPASLALNLVSWFCHQMSYFKDKMHQIRFWLGSAPDPTLGAHSAPLDHLAGFKGSYFEGKGRKDRGQKESELKGFFFIFKHLWAPKRSWKISHGGPGKSWIFLSVKEWEPCTPLATGLRRQLAECV